MSQYFINLKGASFLFIIVLSIILKVNKSIVSRYFTTSWDIYAKVKKLYGNSKPHISIKGVYRFVYLNRIDLSICGSNRTWTYNLLIMSQLLLTNWAMEPIYVAQTRFELIWQDWKSCILTIRWLGHYTGDYTFSNE